MLAYLIVPSTEPLHNKIWEDIERILNFLTKFMNPNLEGKFT